MRLFHIGGVERRMINALSVKFYWINGIGSLNKGNEMAGDYIVEYNVREGVL